MRVLTVICIFFSLFTSFSQYCTQDLYPMRGANKMMGYVNVQKEWVIQPYFDKASSFTGNMALVQRKGKIGAVNCDGKLIIRCEYDDILPFFGGRAWYRKGSKWGVIKDDGNIVLPPLYDEIREIAKYTDQTWVKNSGGWGVYDKFREKEIWKPQFSTYNQTIDAKYSFVTSGSFTGLVRVDSSLQVTNTAVSVSHDYLKRKYIVTNSFNKQGVLKYNGDVILPISSDSIFFSKGRYIVRNNNVSSLYSLNGVLIKGGFESFSSFNDRLIARVGKSGKVNYVTRKGKRIFRGSYKELKYIKEHNNFIAQNSKGVVLVSKSEKKITPYFKSILKGNGFFIGINNNEKKQLISAEGYVCTVDFEDIVASDSVNQIRVTSTLGKLGFYDLTSLSTKTKIEYDALTSMAKGFAVYKKNGKMGVLNNKFIAEISNEDTVEVVETSKGKVFFITTNNTLKGIFNQSMNVISAQNEYTSIEMVHDYFVITSAKGTKGIMTQKGSIPVLVNNKEVISLSNNKFAVSKKGKTFLIYNNKGKILYNEAKFEGVKSIDYNLIPVKKNGLWGYINQKNGKQVVDFFYKEAFTYSEIDGEVLGKVIKQTGETVYLTLRGKEKR